MDFQHVAAVLVAAQLVLVLLSIVISRNKIKSTSKRTQGNETTKSYGDGKCRSDTSGDPDVIIVGAGVAGSALAYALGKDGRRVHVIERDLSEPDRIVGEFLLPGGHLKLIELGLEDCVEGIDGCKTIGLSFHKDGNRVDVPFPLKDFHPNVTGIGLHNGRFVQKLREKAASLPNVNLEQGTVVSLMEEKGAIKGVRYRTKSNQELTASAPLTIVCDGSFSNLRRSLCDPKIEIPSCFVGLALRNCDLPQAKYSHMILGDSLILVYRISSTEIRCLVDVLGQKAPSIPNGDMAHFLKTVIAPQIPSGLYDAFITAVDEGNMRTMLSRSMPSSPYPTPGAFLMGDALNMRHPLTGGGMTVALSDVVLLRDLLRPLHDITDPATISKTLESFYVLRKPMASTLNTIANALHKILCSSSDPVARKEMRQAFFEYFSLGDVTSAGFAALLTGLNPSPLSLLFQLSAMLVYSVGRILLPFPSPGRLFLAARLLLAAAAIILPVIKAEGVRHMLFPITFRAYYTRSIKSI